VATHPTLGTYRLVARESGADGGWLLTENETADGPKPAGPAFGKDAFTNSSWAVTGTR
jgi:hypothetical protein